MGVEIGLNRGQERVVYQPEFTFKDVPYFAQSVAFANQIATVPGSEVIKQHELEIRNKFSVQKGVPVIISAFNEEKDLPRVLYSLSLSRLPVRPIVVNNRSSDGTREIAESLGVEVIDENRPGMLNAEIAGLKYVTEQQNSSENILFCEADGIPGKLWSETILKSLQKLPDGGGQVFGAYWYYGGTKASDSFLSAYYLSKTAVYTSLYNKVSSHGGNSGLKLDKEGKLVSAIKNMDTTITLHDSETKKNAIKSVGVPILRNMNPLSLSLTQSNRYPDMKAVIKLILMRGKYQKAVYGDWFRQT